MFKVSHELPINMLDKSFEINPNDGSIKDKKVKKVWSREYQKGWEISTNL